MSRDSSSHRVAHLSAGGLTIVLECFQVESDFDLDAFWYDLSHHGPALDRWADDGGVIP